MARTPGVELDRLKAFLAGTDDDDVDPPPSTVAASPERTIGFCCLGCESYTYIAAGEASSAPQCARCGGPMEPWWEAASGAPGEGCRLDRYQLVGEIGRGGMGVVYEARDPALDRRVAIKMLKDPSGSPGKIERLHREAQLLAQLQHANIVAIHEVGLVPGPMGRPGAPYIVMELAERTSFRDLLAPLARDKRIELVAKVARAIGHAHAKGVIHRDLKPENILVRGDGEPIVTDFGLARRTADSEVSKALTRTGAIMGTVPYMAPEQLLGRTAEIGPASDVWALGAMLYEVLTGRLPFTGTAAELYQRIPHDDPVLPRKLDRAIPTDIQTICLACLEKAPGKRYSDASALADDLANALAGRPIAARPGPSIARAWRNLRRHPWYAAAGLLLLAAAAVGVSWRAREAALVAEAERTRLAWHALEAQVAEARRVVAEWDQQRYGRRPHPLVAHRRRMTSVKDSLAEAVTHHASAHEALAELGWLRFQLGDLTAARRTLERAIELAPEDGLYRFRLGRVLMAFYEREEGKSFRVCAHSYPETFARLAQALATQRGAIVEQFRAAAARLDRDRSPAWMRDYASAYAAWFTGDVELARTQCERMAQEYPLGGEEALMLLGHMAERAVDRIAWYDKAIESAGSFSDAYLAAAQARIRCASMTVGPQDAPPPSREQARAWFAEAIALAREAIGIDDESTGARIALGAAELERGRFERGTGTSREAVESAFLAAAMAFQGAVAIDSEAFEAWLGRGEAARELAVAMEDPGRSASWFAWSEAWLGRAVALDEGAARGWEQRARLYLEMGDCSQARDALVKARTLEPMLEQYLEPLLQACWASHAKPGG